MVTFKNYDVKMSVPPSLSALLAGGAGDPALVSAPPAPALVGDVSFGTRLFLLAAGTGSFDGFADFLAKVVNHALAGTESELSSDEASRFAASRAVVIELRNSIFDPISSVSALKTFFTGWNSYSALNPGNPIAYRLIDLSGRTLQRKVTQRYVNATCTAP